MKNSEQQVNNEIEQALNKACVISRLELDIQQLIDKYEADKKRAFENMQLMKGHEQYPWYEATWNNCFLFIHSLEDLKLKLNGV